MERYCMATAYRGFQLGLLPERRINKRAVATGYGLVAPALLLFIIRAPFGPELRRLRQYRGTEWSPLPPRGLNPERSKFFPKWKQSLFPAVKLPVFEKPKLVMPRDVKRELPQTV